MDSGHVRVTQRGKRPGLALEAQQALFVVRESLGQHLERDLTLETRVPGEVDLAHASAAQWAEDLIEGERLADGQGHAQPA